MTFLIPIVMYGWIPFTIILFLNMPVRKAVLVSVIGGVLFLPMSTFDIPIIPIFNKDVAVAIGLLLGEIISREKNRNPMRIMAFDIPMIVWCFISPFFSSIANSLGWYDGLSAVIQNFLSWGVFYWMGRRYFSEISSLRMISISIIIGGIIYIPLILFELRMSPLLSYYLYGFFPHTWSQHVRYGGYRPIVFMQHGLMVALWMSATFSISLWMWRNKIITHIKTISIPLIVISLFVITILCKSANGWFFLFLSIICYVYYRKFNSTLLFQLLLISIPAYIMVRSLNIVSIETIQQLISRIFDDERTNSLLARLIQENLFGKKALERPIFGWGGYNRGWPIDPSTGEPITEVIDSMFVAILSTRGYIGLASMYGSMLIGPILILKSINKNNKKTKMKRDTLLENYSIDSIVLSLIVIFYVIDSLLNGMFNPVYVLCAGALVSSYETSREKKAEIYRKPLLINGDFNG